MELKTSYGLVHSHCCSVVYKVFVNMLVLNPPHGQPCKHIGHTQGWGDGSIGKVFAMKA